MNIQNDITNIQGFYPTHSEILKEIFSYLSPKDLGTTSLVCNIFNHIAQSEDLRSRSLDQYYQDPNSFSMEQTQSSAQVERIYQTQIQPDVNMILDRNMLEKNTKWLELIDSDDDDIMEMRKPIQPEREVSSFQQAVIDQDMDELKFLIGTGFKADRMSLETAVVKNAPIEVILLLKKAGAKCDEDIIRDALNSCADECILAVLLEGEHIVNESLINHALNIGVQENIINLLFQHMQE